MDRSLFRPWRGEEGVAPKSIAAAAEVGLKISPECLGRQLAIAGDVEEDERTLNVFSTSYRVQSSVCSLLKTRLTSPSPVTSQGLKVMFSPQRRPAEAFAGEPCARRQSWTETSPARSSSRRTSPARRA
jgi:hypothetical protein